MSVPVPPGIADLELANRQEFIDSRPFKQVALKAHLEESYGIGIDSTLPIDDDPATRPRDSWPDHYPSTLVVKHTSGRQRIARVFSSSADLVSHAEGDAEILQFLATQDFPAERVAHNVPVTVLDGKGIIVTHVHRLRTPERCLTSAVVEMADPLGRLHSLPQAGGAIARDGGAEEHGDGLHVGRPKEDLTAAMSFLVSVEDKVNSAAREKFDWLRDQLEKADDAEGLPETLTHSNYHPWAAVGTPGDISIVG